MELTRGSALAVKMANRKLHTDNVYMFVPNIIGYARLALLVMAFFYARENYVLAVSAYLVSAFLDELDGRAARALGQTSVFGQQLDEITDEIATFGIAAVCCCLYPEYIWYFQLHTAVDIAGHWAHMHNSVLGGNGHHKTGQKNPILRIYWTHQVLGPIWVYSNHVFLAMTYLSYFTQGPVVSLFGCSIGVFKLIAWISAPWAISRAIINGVMMVEAFRSFARMDTAKRVAQRQQNGQVVPNGIAMTAVDHVHQN